MKGYWSIVWLLFALALVGVVLGYGIGDMVTNTMEWLEETIRNLT